MAGESCAEYIDPVPSVCCWKALVLVAELNMGLMVEGCVRLGDDGEGSGAVARGGGGCCEVDCVAGADGGVGCDTAAAAAAAYRIGGSWAGVRGAGAVVGVAVVGVVAVGRFRETTLDIGFAAKFIGGGLAILVN